MKTRTIYRPSLLLVVLASTILVGAISTRAAQAQPAWGYAWAQQATGAFVAQPAYSRNSSGNAFGQGVANTITTLGTGRYRVDFPGIGGLGGNVQVTAYGGNARCKVQQWQNAGGALRVFVRCHNPAGGLTNSRFTASYVRQTATPGRRGGYLWANQPASAVYIPSAAYQWSSTGALSEVLRLGPGHYRATFFGQDFTGGSVQVTAYGTDSNYCKVQSWGHVGNDTRVTVRCFNAAGNPSNAAYTLNFSRHYPNLGNSYSFAWANQAAAANYTPSAIYQRGFIGGDAGNVATDITASRTSLGRYEVDLPGMSSTGSSVKVTAYGAGSEYCNVRNWSAFSGGTTARVRCFDASGDRVDTRFVLVYTDDLAVFQ